MISGLHQMRYQFISFIWLSVIEHKIFIYSSIFGSALWSPWAPPWPLYYTHGNILSLHILANDLRAPLDVISIYIFYLFFCDRSWNILFFIFLALFGGPHGHPHDPSVIFMAISHLYIFWHMISGFHRMLYQFISYILFPVIVYEFFIFWSFLALFGGSNGHPPDPFFIFMAESSLCIFLLVFYSSI